MCILVEKGAEQSSLGDNWALMRRRSRNPVDVAIDPCIFSPAHLVLLPTRRTYVFGFLNFSPSAGRMKEAYTLVTCPVLSSLSKRVTLIGNGTLRSPTGLPGARRKKSLESTSRKSALST